MAFVYGNWWELEHKMSEIKNFRNYLLNYKSKITFKETNAKELVSEIKESDE